MAITIQGSGITETEIADSAITSTKIADGTITNTDINSAASIDSGKITGVLKTTLSSDTSATYSEGSAFVSSGGKLYWKVNDGGTEKWMSSTSGELAMNAAFSDIYSNPYSMQEMTGGTAVMKADGTVWSCGSGQVHGLGNVDITTWTQINIPNIKQICGKFILQNDGTLWGTGYNYWGQLGLGEADNGAHHNKTSYVQITTITDVDDILVGDNYGSVKKTDGSIWTTSGWVQGNGAASNRTWLRMNSTMENSFEDIYSGYSTTFIKKTDGTLWVVSSNNHGEAGTGNTPTDANPYVQVPGVSDIKQVSQGVYHSMLLKNDGTVWATGSNSSGQLGLGDTTNRSSFTQVPITGVKFLKTGGYFTSLIKEDGSVWTCGKNDAGQLGLGDTTDRTSFTNTGFTNAHSIIKTWHSLYIVKEDGTVWGCGSNSNGRLGLGDTTNRNTIVSLGITAKMPPVAGPKSVTELA